MAVVNVAVWDWRRKVLVALLHPHINLINAVTFTPDGTQLVTEADDGTLRIYP